MNAYPKTTDGKTPCGGVCLSTGTEPRTNASCQARELSSSTEVRRHSHSASVNSSRHADKNSVSVALGFTVTGDHDSVQRSATALGLAYVKQLLRKVC